MKYWNVLLSAAIVAAFASSSAFAGQAHTSSNVDRAGGAEQPLALGDVDQDLVFTPVTPCRLLDTRLAGGIIGATTTRDFIGFTDSDFSAQGGADNDCGIPTGAAAIQVNLAMVNPAQAGYATAYPFGEDRPLAATLNYLAGATIANEVVIPLTQGETMDFSLYSHRQAHAVADVSGYYMRPNATAVQCTYAIENVPVAAGALDQGFINCPTGYGATGGSCNAGSGVANARDVVIVASEPSFSSGQAWFCMVQNDGAVTRSYRRAARCCRVPGR